MITLFELTFAKVIEWIPIWPYAKLILTCWLVIPYFSDVFSKPDDILTAAEKYIEENGTSAFENLITKGKSKSSSGYTFYDEDY
ncbi:hypothetical protein OIU77_000616 [Salix suchowensis]|uniref:HVA22-like protein n=1 Tax=Salix suchowensis TaxID=1278906 RepID=A0ABQ9B846_9ROSI|nr:hypothetical protein OIU77_000616 [Salix suchowensis]